MPGGGTTDYAVHIYYDAIRYNRYESYIAAGTKMDHDVYARLPEGVHLAARSQSRSSHPIGMLSTSRR